MITSLGAEAVERAQAIARQADIIAALTLEVLKGTTKAFDSGEQLQQRRPNTKLQWLLLTRANKPNHFCGGGLLQISTCCVHTRDRWRWLFAFAPCWTQITIHPRLQVRGNGFVTKHAKYNIPIFDVISQMNSLDLSRGWCGVLPKGGCIFLLTYFVWSGSPESHRFCDRVQDAYTMRCCPQVSSRPHPQFML